MLPRALVAQLNQPAGRPLYFFGAFPVQLNVTSCGSPTTLSVIVSVPEGGLVSVGVQVTLTLQLFPGASVSMHSVPATI